MTWRHVAVITAALALPVICGFSQACSGAALKEVIGLSMAVVVGALGNASSSTKDKVS